MSRVEQSLPASGDRPGVAVPILDSGSAENLAALLARLPLQSGAALLAEVRTLARLKSRASVPALLAVIERGEPDAAQEAAQALATIGGSAVCERLLEIVARRPTVPVRRAAVYALVWLLAPKAFVSLLDRFRDPAEDLEVRSLAAEGLVYLLRDTEVPTDSWLLAVDAFLAGLEDPHVSIRYWSVCAVRSLRLGSALPQLRMLAVEDAGGDAEAGWSIRDEAQATIGILQPEFEPSESRAKTA